MWRINDSGYKIDATGKMFDGTPLNGPVSLRQALMNRSDAFINAFINAVQSAITAGEKVTLPGFGTFSPALRKARTGMDPRTRAPVQIPERKSAKFSVGSKFKAQVQGS